MRRPGRWAEVDRSNPESWPALDEAGLSFLNETLGTVTDGPVRPARLDAPLPAGLEAQLSDAPDPLLPDLLAAAVAAGASDIHISAGRPPVVRVDGDLRPLSGAPVPDAARLGAAIDALLGPDQRAALRTSGDLDLAIEVGVQGRTRRFRVALYRESTGPAAAVRLVPDTIPTIEVLGLPPTLLSLTRIGSGLVLVTGPTGSGKSTTLAALIDRINTERGVHIVTIEDPIEYVHQDKRSMVHQREIGVDTPSFSNAVRHAMRQDPDVILIGELRDLETIRIALTAAETGHLVFATLHSGDTEGAVNRLIDVFPGDQQAQIRTQLSSSLVACVSQRLLPTVDGGRIAATEVMVATSGVRNLIRESKTHQLSTLLETSAETGMHSFDQSLATLVQRGVVHVDVALSAGSRALRERLRR